MITYEQVKDVSFEEYYRGNALSINAVKNKYIISEFDEKTPAAIIWRVALYIASAEKTQKLQEYWAQRWFHEIWCGYWMPAGSIISGSKNPNKVSLSNCTTLGFESDTLESIFETSYAVAKCAAYRQGLGVHFGLRPKGARIHNSSRESSGNVHWMKHINNIGFFVGQKGRIPAMLFSIADDNTDLIEFITVKSDQTTIENANISVHWSDKFMKALENNEEWEMFYSVKDTGEVLSFKEKAKKIFDLFVDNNWAYAEPGAQFIDRAKEYSNSNYLANPIYDIKSTNACSEQYLEFGGVDVSAGLCNLASFNMGALPNIRNGNIEKQKQIVRDVFAPSINRFLDNVITMELKDKRYAIPGQKNSLENLRRIGAGVTNLDGYLIRNGVGYDTPEGYDVITGIMEAFSSGMYNSSILLGEEKGSFKAFNREEFIKAPNVKYMKDAYGYEFKTMRNVTLTSIAPTGTLTITLNHKRYGIPDSYGIEPVMGFYYWKRHRTSGKWEWTFNIPSFVLKKLWSVECRSKYQDLFSGSPDIENLLKSGSVNDPEGTIGEKMVPVIEEFFPKEKFKPAHEINPFHKVKLMGELTKKSVDSSISVTYNLPENVEKKVIRDLYVAAWKEGVKSVSIYRDKSRFAIVEFEPPRIAEKRYTTDKGENVNGDNIIYRKAPKRPQSLACEVHKINVVKEKWIVFIGLLKGKPYEVFAGRVENIDVPKKISYGNMIKEKFKGKAAYNFEHDGETLIKDIAHHFSDLNQAFTRMVSLQLRHGTPIEFVIDQLSKSPGSIVDMTKAISRVLKKYATWEIDGEKITSGTCPECGQPLVYIDGCRKCSDEDNCGYSGDCG